MQKPLSVEHYIYVYIQLNLLISQKELKKIIVQHMSTSTLLNSIY